MRYFLVLAFLFFTKFSLAQEISNIIITGLDSISRGTVLNYLPVEKGDTYSNSLSSSIIKNLYKTGLFKDIKVTFQESNLTINITENPTILYIDILNYDDGKVLSSENLSKMKSNFRVNPGQLFLEKNLQDLVNTIKSLYKDNAYYNAKIDVNNILKPNNKIALEISINEGERALIQSFQIKGNSFFETGEIEKLFDLGEPDIFFINFFTKKDEFNQFVFDAGVASLEKLYFDNGFMDLEILEKNVDIDEEKNAINILINISEGERYKFGDISINGSDIFSYQKIRNLIKLESGDFFDRKILLQGLREIQTLYTDLGYAYADIDSKVNLSKENSIINIDLDIQEKGKVYINRINIFGNTRTQDDVIRRELSILEGQIYSKKFIDESIKRIKRLGFFSNVNVDYLATELNSDKMDINIKVEETKTGEISFGLSQSNSTGTAVNAGIQQRNILGTGNTFNASLSNSSAVKQLSFFFSNPHFNDLGHSISYGLFNKKIDGSSLDVSSYKIDETGGSFGYGVPLFSSSDLKADFKISNIDLLCGSVLASAGYEYEQCNQDKNIDLNGSISYLSDTLNDYVFPTDGQSTNLKLTTTLPFSDYNYMQLSGSYKYYFPISNDLTFNFKTRLNLGKGFGDDDLPFFKRYYGGGSSSVKGFDFNSLGPKYPNGLSKGGEISYLSGISVISPIKIIEDSENMRIAGFLDVGSINEKFTDFGVNEFRASTGLALTWLTPLGPLGVYYAEPILKKSADQTEALSFTLGSSF